MKTLKILFIDDDEIERLKFKKICESSAKKTSIIFAKNGEDALLKLEQFSPNLILLDLNMPKMNGIEFLDLLKSNSKLKYIPILVLTSSAQHIDLKNCFEIGIAGYFIKPLRYEDYNGMIGRILNYWNQNKFTD